MECPFGPFPIHREDIRPHVELREPLAAAFADDWVRRSPAVWLGDKGSEDPSTIGES